MLQGEHIEAIWTGSTWLAMYFRGVVVDEVVNGYQVAPNGKWVNYTFHHDNLQSVLGLSGHDGTMLQTLAYDPVREPRVDHREPDEQHLDIHGQGKRPDTGLYYYRVRPYDPITGTFITEDPMGFAAGVNFYQYCGSNPLNCSDPYGFTGRSVALGAISTALSTASLFTTPAPPVALGLKIAGAAVSIAAITNAGYELYTGQTTRTAFWFTVIGEGSILPVSCR